MLASIAYCGVVRHGRSTWALLVRRSALTSRAIAREAIPLCARILGGTASIPLTGSSPNRNSPS